MNDKFDSRAEWLASISIQPHQHRSVETPATPAGLLGSKPKLSRNAVARRLNDFLADASAC